MMPPDQTPPPAGSNPKNMPRTAVATKPLAAPAAASTSQPPAKPTPAATEPPVPATPAKEPTALEILQQYGKNLEAMRKHYRLQPEAGRELGHLVILEMALTDTTRALELAFEGKLWAPKPLK